MVSRERCSTASNHFKHPDNIHKTTKQFDKHHNWLVFKCLRPNECPSHPPSVHFNHFEVISQLTLKQPPEWLQIGLVSLQWRKSFLPDFRPAGPQGGAESCKEVVTPKASAGSACAEMQLDIMEADLAM